MADPCARIWESAGDDLAAKTGLPITHTLQIHTPADPSTLSGFLLVGNLSHEDLGK